MMASSGIVREQGSVASRPVSCNDNSMLNKWHEAFSGCEPVTYLVTDVYPDRWVRFHSLPGSKRYPDTEAEYATVLYRHNCVLRELVDGKGQLVLLTTGYSDSPEPFRQPELQPLDPQGVPWRTFRRDDGVAGFWHVFASTWEWEPSVFDPIVLLTANDITANVMIVEPDCRWLLHPYDGGMDVLAESEAARDKLKVAHQGWLSPRPDGL